MKTTIEISDVVLEKAKALASREGTTLRALVEDGLRHVLKTRRAAEGYRLRDASVDGQGLSPEFRDASWERVRAAVYEDKP